MKKSDDYFDSQVKGTRDLIDPPSGSH